MIKKYLVWLLVLSLSYFGSAQSKKVRTIDIRAQIVDTTSRDTVFTKDVVKFGSYIINSGPDTIIAGDRLYIKYSFAGIVFSPQFPWVYKDLIPGDTFFWVQPIQINFSFDHDSVNLCVFARMSVTQQDSIPKERGNKLKDNNSCFTRVMRKWHLNTKDVSKASSSAYPNPVHTFLLVPHIKNEKVELFDCTGKRVTIDFKTDNQNMILDVSQTKEGIYFLRQGEQVQKIIVLHQ